VLALKVQGAQSEYFFQSTRVQTLFYGVLSAWVGVPASLAAQAFGAFRLGKGL